MEAELLIELYGNSLLTELFCCFIPMNNSVLLGALLFSVSIGVCSGLMRLTVFLFPCDFYLAIVSSDLMHCLSFFNLFVDAIFLFRVLFQDWQL